MVYFSIYKYKYIYINLLTYYDLQQVLAFLHVQLRSTEESWEAICLLKSVPGQHRSLGESCWLQGRAATR